MRGIVIGTARIVILLEAVMGPLGSLSYRRLEGRRTLVLWGWNIHD
jgi:hypothetical protein